MSRKNSAPTHGWVISSQINKWMALLFMLNLFFWLIAVTVIRHQIVRDCHDTYRRDLKVFGYWIQVNAGSTKDGCPSLE